MDSLQAKHLIEYILLNQGRIVKYKIRSWNIHNTVLDYNCPCQKNTGFFFMPYVTAMELLSTGKASQGAYEKRNHQEDDSVLHGVGKLHCDPKIPGWS